MILPFRRGYLVCNQTVRRISIRNSQQRLCNTHQQNALLRGQIVLLKECFDTAIFRGVFANRSDELLRSAMNFLARRNTGVGCIGQLAYQRLFIGEV